VKALASGARLAPAPGNRWLKNHVRPIAWVAARTRNTYLRAQVLRLKVAAAILAVAASILPAAYYILRERTAYHELGPDYFDRQRKAQLTRRLIRRLEDLGLSVEVRPSA